ncbi:hypothetical protein JCM33374_g4399 [Metschnikowia sp. JCM 33374]|nr:hypothetical protein JCM33374_g4399 [Metschnikowia sp. JCM 33374]
MNLVTEENSEWERTSSEKDDLVIQLMAELHKGTSDAGLLRIVEKVRKFKEDYPDESDLKPETSLRRLISGYGIGSEKSSINGTKTSVWVQDKSDVRSAERGRRNASRVHAKAIKGVEDDFYPLRTPEGAARVHAHRAEKMASPTSTTNGQTTLTETKTTDGNKNYSTVTETEDGDLTVTETDKIDGDKSYCTVPETENIGRDKSYCTAPETANTDRDKSDFNYDRKPNTKRDQNSSSIPVPFIGDEMQQGPLIQDFQSWGHLSIYDSGGHHHLSEGYGHIKLGDHVIQCYYVPTLEKVGYMERQHFHSMVGFVGLQNKKDKFNAYNIHRVHAHPNVEVTRQYALDNQIPFTKADETAIRNCPSCFPNKGQKKMSHNGHPSNPQYPLHRLHMDSMELGNSRHAILVHNTVPNSEGSTPKALLHGKKVKINRGMPIFGSDVIVQLSNASDLKERKLQAHRLPGIYVGTYASNSVVHLIWTNFKQPYEKMVIKEYCNISFNYEFTHMRQAEAAMETAAHAFATADEPTATASFPNLIVSQPRSKASKARKATKVPKIKTVEPGPPLHAEPQFTQEQRDLLLQHVDEHASLKNQVELLTHDRQAVTEAREAQQQAIQSSNDRIAALEDGRRLMIQYIELLRENLAEKSLSMHEIRETITKISDKFEHFRTRCAIQANFLKLIDYQENSIQNYTPRQTPARSAKSSKITDFEQNNERRNNNLRTAFTQGYESLSNHLDKGLHAIADHTENTNAVRDQNIRTELGHALITGSDMITQYIDHRIADETQPAAYIVHDAFFDEIRREYVEVNRHQIEEEQYDQTLIRDDAASTNNPAGKLITADGVSIDIPTEEEMTDEEMTSNEPHPFDPITTDTIHSHTAADTDVFSTDDSDGPATTDESLDNIGPLDSPGHDGNDPAHDSEDEYSDASEHFIPAREESHKSSSAPIHDATAAFPDRPPTEPLPSTHITSSVADAPADVSPTMGAPDPVSITMGADPPTTAIHDPVPETMGADPPMLNAQGRSPQLVPVPTTGPLGLDSTEPTIDVNLRNVTRLQKRRQFRLQQRRQSNHPVSTRPSKNRTRTLNAHYSPHLPQTFFDVQFPEDQSVTRHSTDRRGEMKYAKLQNMEVYDEVEKHAKPNAERLIGTRFVYTGTSTTRNQTGRYDFCSKDSNKEIEREDLLTRSTARTVSRLFMTTSVIKRMELKAMDVSECISPFEPKIPVYVRPPSGIRGVDDRKLWMCTKALYGIKNAGRAWYLMIKEKLEENGFKRVRSERSIFRKITARGTEVIIALYVDDLLVGVEDEKDYEDFQNYMRDEAKIKIKDLGEAKDFCGVQIDRIDGGYKIHQKKYIDELLGKFERFMTQETQTVPFKEYDRERYESELNAKELRLYQELLGSYNWLAGISRPDLGFCVSKFGSLTKGARDVDLAQLKRVLLYLRDTKDFAIEIRENHYPDNKVKLYAFADASFANEEGRKSRTGYIIYLNGTPIAWKSKKQTLVTTSTHASEYVALSTTVNDLLWLRDLFQELGIETVEVPKILEDNRGVVLSVNGTGNNPSCNKHLDVKVKHVQERVSIGDIEVESVGTEDNVADTLTKGLTRIPFGRHYPYLGFDGKFMIRALKAMRSYCPVCRE